MRFGEDKQLFVYLARAGGTGNSHVAFSIHLFCKEVSTSAHVLFDAYSYLITVCSGSVAALLNGTKIHSFAYMMKDDCNITNAFR